MARRTLAPGSPIVFTPIRYPSPTNGRNGWAQQVRSSMVPVPQEAHSQVSLADMLISSGISYGTGVALGAANKMLPEGLGNWDLISGLALQTIAFGFNSPLALASANSCYSVSGFRSVDKLMSLLSGEEPATTVSGEKSTDEDPVISQCKSILK